MPSSTANPSEATKRNLPCLPVDNPTQCFCQMEGHDLSNHRSRDELPGYSDLCLSVLDMLGLAPPIISSKNSVTQLDRSLF